MADLKDSNSRSDRRAVFHQDHAGECILVSPGSFRNANTPELGFWNSVRTLLRSWKAGSVSDRMLCQKKEKGCSSFDWYYVLFTVNYSRILRSTMKYDGTAWMTWKILEYHLRHPNTPLGNPWNRLRPSETTPLKAPKNPWSAMRSSDTPLKTF